MDAAKTRRRRRGSPSQLAGNWPLLPPAPPSSPKHKPVCPEIQLSPLPATRLLFETKTGREAETRTRTRSDRLRAPRGTHVPRCGVSAREHAQRKRETPRYFNCFGRDLGFCWFFIRSKTFLVFILYLLCVRLSKFKRARSGRKGVDEFALFINLTPPPPPAPHPHPLDEPNRTVALITVQSGPHDRHTRV